MEINTRGRAAAQDDTRPVGANAALIVVFEARTVDLTQGVDVQPQRDELRRRARCEVDPQHRVESGDIGTTEWP